MSRSRAAALGWFAATPEPRLPPSSSSRSLFPPLVPVSSLSPPSFTLFPLRRPRSLCCPPFTSPPSRRAFRFPGCLMLNCSLTPAARPRPRAFCCTGSSKPSVLESAPEGENVAGGRNCLWRVELSGLCLELLVGACRIALRGQNRPPGTGKYPPARRKATKTPSKAVRYGEENRLVFKIDGEVLRIVQRGTHYGDF